MIEAALVSLVGAAVALGAMIAARAGGLLGPPDAPCWRSQGCVIKDADPSACASCSVYLAARRARRRRPAVC